MKARTSKSPYVWSPLSPRCSGIYWYRDDDNSAAQLVRVYRDSGGEWCVQYRQIDADLGVPVEDEDDNCDFVANFRGQYAGPVHQPREP